MTPAHLATRMAARMTFCLLLAATGALAANRPHILYITANDLGWKDVGYHGSIIQTPILDRLAAAGARLEQFYVQPFATQTRAAALTGRYPMRYGLQTLQIQSSSQFGLPPEERVLAQALKEAGYRTVVLGEWRLGHAKKEYWPTQRGFDHFYGHVTGGIDYFSKVSTAGQRDWWRNTAPAKKDDGYLTTLLAAEAVKVIEKHATTAPLFLYLSFSAPQAPLQAPKEYLTRYQDSTQEPERSYQAMITAVDSAIGTVLSAFAAGGMLDDTLIVFHAATGGALPAKYTTGDGDAKAAVASNGPYLGGRGSLYEGGVRAAAFAHWPGKIPSGVVSELMHVVDLYPTLLGRAQGKLEQAKPLDGIDMWPVISSGQPSPRKEALLNVEDFRGGIRVGDWKLITTATLPGRLELYNLRADPSEEDNQAEREPEKTQQLLKRLTDYAWDMAPALYLEELSRPHRTALPMYWGDNPARP